MTALDDYSQRWELSCPELFAETPTSHVYKVRYQDKTSILKILTDTGRNCERQGTDYLLTTQKYDSAPVYMHDDGAVLMRFIDGRTLKQHVTEGEDEDATNIIGHVVQKLHQATIPQKHSFETFRDRFKYLFNYAENPDYPDILREGRDLAEYMLSSHYTPCLLHGDIHHENILQDTDLGWWVIDPQPLIGDPAYDVANTLHNPDQMPELTESEDRLLKQTQTLGEILNIDPQRIINYAFIHGCLSACWSHSDDGDAFEGSLSINTSQILKPHIGEV